MTRDDMIGLAHRMYAAANARDLDAVDEIFAPGFQGVGITGPDQVRQAWSTIMARYPDFQITLEDVLVDGDRMALRATVTGTARTDAADGYLTEWVRAADGQITEVWGVTNVALR
jgi:predicted ester cyclase